jgi:hypothetical protein
MRHADACTRGRERPDPWRAQRLGPGSCYSSHASSMKSLHLEPTCAC